MELNWLNIGSLIFDFISTIAMLFVTYYLHKMANKASKRDNYMSQIAEIYNKIEENVKVLVSHNNLIDLNEAEREKILALSRRCISVNSVFFIYYLLRIPGKYKERWKFFEILYAISRNPDELNNYVRLSEKLKEFCWEFHEKDNNIHGFKMPYDGSPLYD